MPAEGGSGLRGSKRRSRSLSAPPRDELGGVNDGASQSGMGGRTQAPTGYYYDAGGDLRKVKAWYDGGSPRGTAEVRWQGSPGRRPQQAALAAAAAAAQLSGTRRSSQNSEVEAERGSEDDEGLWDADRQGLDPGWLVKGGLDRGRGAYKGASDGARSGGRARSASPAVLWRRRLVGSYPAAAPGSARRPQQLEEESWLRQEGMERLQRERRSSELLVRWIPRSVAAVESPQRGESGAADGQLREGRADAKEAEEALYSVAGWKWVGKSS